MTVKVTSAEVSRDHQRPGRAAVSEQSQVEPSSRENTAATGEEGSEVSPENVDVQM